MGKKLWARDFTIITLGTVVSMLGNAVSSIAIGLLVLDFTNSTFMYALFLVMNNLPRLVMPIIAGPYLDRFSRRKMIYILDFISSGVYLLIFILLSAGLFNVAPFMLLCLLIGAIDSTYQVAYDSLYPNLVKTENYRKAYSISSVLQTFSMAIIPVAAFMYEFIGVAPLFLFNSIVFFIAAVMETFIKGGDKHISGEIKKFSLRGYKNDFKQGINYIKGERGLMIIIIYFSLNFFFTYGPDNMVLPYFKNTEGLGVTVYTLVMSGIFFGRLIGGVVHYAYRYPANKKYNIAVFVYLLIAVINSFVLFMPLPVMAVLYFITGLAGVTSYNIRISATQTYIPDSHRARFNGVFIMIINLGMIISQLIFGALAEFISIRALVVAGNLLLIICIFLVVVKNKKDVKKIYNMDI